MRLDLDLKVVDSYCFHSVESPLVGVPTFAPQHLIQRELHSFDRFLVLNHMDD